MKRNFFAFLLTITLLLPSAAFGQAAVRISPAERAMAAGVTAEQIKQYLYFVASDAMGGRDTPSQGLDVTAEFIKMNLWKWGFKPAGDNGTFFQKMTLNREAVDAATAFMEVGGQRYAFGEEFFRMAGNTTGTLDKPLVFAGNGWLVKSKNIDAYAGLDVSGKIVVVQMQGAPTNASLIILPKGVTRADLKPEAKGTDWADPVAYARQKGAAGVIYIASPELQGFWGQVKQFLGSGGAMKVKGLDDEPATGAVPALPVILASQKVGEALFAGETGNSVKTPDTAPFALSPAKKVGISVSAKTESATTQNVVAIWEGSDPVLKNEMVAIGAHYDHVGINPNASGPDKIWNGADDDGSGTVAVLAIAEALAKAKTRPKRSILFVWHAGEEKGLWGSEYFNKFPTVDIKNVVAQLNIDMIGRSRKADDVNPKNKNLSGENAIYVIGAEMMSSTLGTITKQTNDAYLKMTYDYRYDDPKDTNRFFFRSDHFNYALNGIPIAFWFDGEHEDYHGPGDHADKIDYAKMEKVTRTIMLTMLEISGLKERPKVDKQLPPELMQR